MCGIFGLAVKQNSEYSRNTISTILEKIALISERRGKDSSGICFRNPRDKKMEVIKGSIPIFNLLKSEKYLRDLNSSLSQYEEGNSFTAIGHSRLVTNGTQTQHNNNQPVVKGGIVSIHNGIIVNTDELWLRHEEISRDYEIDTEIFNSLVEYNDISGKSVIDTLTKSFDNIEGTISTALLFDYRDELILATNNGSLYSLSDNNILVFASERHFLRVLKEQISEIKNLPISPIKSNTGIHLDYKKFVMTNFTISSNHDFPTSKFISEPNKYKIEISTIDDKNIGPPTLFDMKNLGSSSIEKVERELLEYNIDSIKDIKRCSKCILPKTFPYIKFDNEEVCNYCNNYKLINHHEGIDGLISLVEPYRSHNEKPDCIVPFSGGRDSTFTLHMIKEKLGLNPITITYDWGMVTDLARRNIARVCGKLGVENIIVAADIHKKRNYIRKNVSAWLRAPNLGMVPLFMAGDKQFFYYTQKIKEETGIDLNIWGINDLENTDFKSGFAGVRPLFSKENIYSLSTNQKINLLTFLGYNFLTTPEYINDSIIDNLKGHISRLRHPKKDFFSFFNFYKWDEKEITDLIINEYDWEIAMDTKSTWRIGDGTASFYNYIYFTVAGFSEVDTFRSNQVRDGLISREDALKYSYNENRPRYENLKWYTTVVGIPYKYTIQKINNMQKLYHLK